MLTAVGQRESSIMSDIRHREEVLNTLLAIVLSRLGVQAEPETIGAQGQKPDVLFPLHGLRVVVEGKLEDVPSADKIVFDDATERVQRGVAHIAAAVVYPALLRTVPISELETKLSQTPLKYRIVHESGQTDWFEGTPDSLLSALRRVQETLAKDDIVQSTASDLEQKLQAVAQQWIGQVGTCDRLAHILGMPAPKGELPDKAEARRNTAARVSALALANALIFQEQLSATDGRIQPLQKLDREKNPVEGARIHWKWIWENVDYVPIFQLGDSILGELPLNPTTINAFRGLVAQARQICANQAALRHDLMGRIYHWLLHNAKYLGTYYTSVAAATLLLKLALSLPWPQDLSDPSELAEFKVSDFACGTGTLLMAAAQAISDVYICGRAVRGRTLKITDLKTLHKALMENVLHGYDVLPSAVHLTASTLAMLAPDISFVRMNLYVMPLGMDDTTPRLGSLDFLSGNKIPTQVSLDYSQAETIRTGAGFSQVTTAKVPKLDLCVMNPPFVRSVGGNLLFGSLPDERGALQQELKRRVKKLPASITAGLGSVFVAVADLHVKECGRLAFVLPAGLLTGEAWGKTRKLIADKYHLELVVASHDAERSNFSENADISEILFIARKLRQGEHATNTKFINLWRNPRSIHEALDLAERIETTIAPPVDGSGIGTIRSTSEKVGEVIASRCPSGDENWSGCLFSQTECFRASWHLAQGELRVPESEDCVQVPLRRLGEIGYLGYDRRDIHDAFEVSMSDLTPYPAFWGHSAQRVTQIAQSPNAHLIARVVPARNRPSKNAQQVWSKSGRLLLAERLRTNTHHTLAIGFEQEVLGNTWWALRTQEGRQKERALLVWLNGTLSVLMYFSRRVTTEGAWMQMKKPGWASMPVLDVTALNKRQLAELESTYENVCSQRLRPLAELNIDPVRAAIDNAICRVLDLPDLSQLRELLAREPGMASVSIHAPLDAMVCSESAVHDAD
jgi:hypothetical protein